MLLGSSPPQMAWGRQIPGAERQLVVMAVPFQKPPGSVCFGMSAGESLSLPHQTLCCRQTVNIGSSGALQMVSPPAAPEGDHVADSLFSHALKAKR